MSQFIIRRILYSVVALRMKSVTRLYSTRRRMNRDIPTPAAYWSFTFRSSQG